MEKLKSTFRNMSLVLITVTVITGALLAVVNHVTEEPIKVQADKVLSDGIKNSHAQQQYRCRLCGQYCN